MVSSVLFFYFDIGQGKFHLESALRYLVSLRDYSFHTTRMEERAMIRRPIIVPNSVNDGQVKKFMERDKNYRAEAVFIERTGYSLQNQLEKADPLKGEDCGRRLIGL